MLNLAICDDDQGTLLQVKKYVEQYKSETDLNIRLHSFISGEALIQNWKKEFDIVILDIQMGGMNGIQIAREIRAFDSKVAIVFLTSIMKYVLEGYEVNAKNYLIKPLSYQRFKEEMSHMVTKWNKDNKYMLVKNDFGKYKIYLNQVMFIETFERNTLIHREHDNIISYKTMKEHEEFLKNHGFFRCHTSYIVNLGFVRDVTNNQIKLLSDDIILLSKNRKKEFAEEWLKYLGDEL